MFSKKAISKVSSVLKYIVEAGPTAGFVDLVPTRDWNGSSERVITALGAHTVAHLAIRGGRSKSETYVFDDRGSEDLVIRVPKSILGFSNIGFRVASDGAAMTARMAAQKQTAKRQRLAVTELTKLGIKF